MIKWWNFSFLKITMKSGKSIVEIQLSVFWQSFLIRITYCKRKSAKRIFWEKCAPINELYSPYVSYQNYRRLHLSRERVASCNGISKWKPPGKKWHADNCTTYNSSSLALPRMYTAELGLVGASSRFCDLCINWRCQRLSIEIVAYGKQIEIDCFNKTRMSAGTPLPAAGIYRFGLCDAEFHIWELCNTYQWKIAKLIF